MQETKTSSISTEDREGQNVVLTFTFLTVASTGCWT